MPLINKTLIWIAILIIAISMSVDAHGVSLPDEQLHYKVTYKWGLIHKQAGTAILTLRNTRTGYQATLTAKSDPWADRIYRLRDTLHSTMTYADMLPLRYERIAHENGSYARDIVEFTRQGDLFTGHATRYRRGSDTNAPLKQAATTLEAEGPTVDLLSSFYYLRTLDFSHIKPGERLTVNIFSGKQKELLHITFKGHENIKLDGTPYPAYHLEFTFTSDGKKKTSGNINAWVSADNRRIPLKLEGSLPIGKVQCFYMPPSSPKP